MKTLSTALQAHLVGELTTLAHLIKITRKDGVIKAFTDHDRDLIVAGTLYHADGAFSLSGLSQDDNLDVERDQIMGLLSSSLIVEEDLSAGLYDHARIDVALCNWQDLGQGVMILRRGWLGEITLTEAGYRADLVGLTDLLAREVGEIYTPECRYDLGDSRCGVSLATYTVTGSVMDVISQTQFVDYTRSEAADYFTYGKLTWTSGANQGLTMEIKAWDNSTQIFTLWLPLPQPISVGDAYQVHRGCDKRFTTCMNAFANVVNFGGFPHLPGINKILQYPDRV